MSRSIDFHFTYHLPLEKDDELRASRDLTHPPPEVSLFQGDKVCYTLAEPIRILSFPIHHDYRDPNPHPVYHEAITNMFSQFKLQLPFSLPMLQWGFDPRKILQPTLYHEIEHQGNRFLFVVQFDLSFRSYWHRSLRRGDNNWTTEYETRRVMMSFDFLPLDLKLSDSNDYYVHQFFDSTWIGEEGRGYYLQGIWMDDDLTEFFSLFLMPDLEAYYPFFPLRCRYQSLSANTWKLSHDGVPKLLEFLTPIMSIPKSSLKEIQQQLKKSDSKQRAQLAQTYRSKLGISPPSQDSLPKIIEKRIAPNGLVEYVIDGTFN